MAMPALMLDDVDDVALARTMMPRARTEIATEVARKGGGKTMIATPVARVRSNDSSLEIPIEAVLDDEDEVPRTRRQITVGDGVLQRVPPRRMWMLHAAVIVATLSIAVVALAASG